MRALGALAHVARDQGREDEALELYEEAVRLGRQQDAPVTLAHAIRHLGDVHRAAGRLEEAERWYVEALELYERHPGAPPLDLANALRPMALVREAKGRSRSRRSSGRGRGGSTPSSGSRPGWGSATSTWRSADEAGVHRRQNRRGVGGHALRGASASTQGTLVFSSEVTHAIPREDPNLMVWAVERVLAEGPELYNGSGERRQNGW